MSKSDAWMPLYVGDYLADTSRLTTEQHGAYLLILMDYWRNGPPLDDDEELATITKLPIPTWRKHSTKIRSLFRSEGGHLIQKRAELEKQKAGHVSAKRSEAGKQGASKRWGKGNASANGNANNKEIANAIANGSQTGSQSGRQSQSQSEKPNSDPAASTTSQVSERKADSASPLDRNVQIAVLLRGWERNRGKASKVASSDPRVLAWAVSGVTDIQLREAYVLAVADREAKGDATAINAGFIDVILAKLLNPGDATSQVKPAPPPKDTTCRVCGDPGTHSVNGHGWFCGQHDQYSGKTDRATKGDQVDLSEG